MSFKILVINPGSTSTKICIFEDKEEVFSETLYHAAEDIAEFADIGEQFNFRLQAVESFLERSGKAQSIHAVVGRGGFMKPVPSGIYEINAAMITDLHAPTKQHASNLGALIADKIAAEYGVKAYVVDPVVVDEMLPIARISGYKEIERKSTFHPLNQKATARKIAHNLGIDYESGNFIIAHMGGGITVGAHCKGQVIDVNNGADGDGPLSPERSGGLPFGDVIGMCYSGRFTEDEIRRQFVGKGGIVSYLGTNDMREAEERAKNGDVQADLLLDALAYQTAKEIGAMASVLAGDVQAIGLTGGIANSQRITGYISEKVKFIAPVHIHPGESEMEAMAAGALRVLQGDAAPSKYTGR